MFKFFKLLIVLILISHLSFAQDLVKQNKNFHLYILIGQSNMAGRGPLTDSFAAIQHPRVEMFTKSLEWKTAKHPLHFDKPSVAAVGPGLSFGIEMAKAKRKIKIGLVPCAVGGTSIAKWQQGAYDDATNTHPYDDAEIRIKEAMKYGVIKGIIWHQGESNSSASGIENYPKQLQELIARVRDLIDNQKTPLVIGELGQYKENYRNFNVMLAEIPKLIPYSVIAGSFELIDKGDGTHFDSASANEFGKRYASKMLEMQSKMNHSNK